MRLLILMTFVGLGFAAKEGQSVGPPNGRVQGIVIDGTTNLPLDGGHVYTRVGERLVRTETNAKGQFVLQDLSPGTYIIHAMKNGYVNLHLASKKTPGDAGVPVTIKRDVPIDDLILRLYRAPIVSGIIIGERGAGIEGVDVYPFRYTYDDIGGRSPVFLRSARTNDKGEFRFNSLAPGEYGFRIEPQTFISRRVTSASRVFFYSYYYPGVVELDMAEAVSVVGGSETRLRDVVVQSRQGGRLRVRVRDDALASTDTPPRRGGISFRRKGEPISRSLGTIDLGTWLETNSLPLGSYEITVDFPIGPTLNRRRVRTNIELGRSDLELDLVLPSPAQLRIRVGTELDSNGTSRPVSGVRLQFVEISSPFDFSPTNTGEMPSVVAETVITPYSDASGISELPAFPPGAYRPRLLNIPSDKYLVGIRQEGRNLSVEGFRVDTGDVVTIDVILGEGTSTLQGTVTSFAGNVVPGAKVVLLQAGSRGGQPPQTATANERGEYSLQTGPGEYKLHAWTELDGSAFQNQEFIKKYQDNGVPIQVGRRGHLKVDVTVPRN